MVKDKFPLHIDELKQGTIKVLPFDKLTNAKDFPHRDDHYMFILQAKGTSSWIIDFKEWALNDHALCFIAPGQVHHYLRSQDADGWLLCVDSRLIPSEYTLLLDSNMHHQQVVPIAHNHPVFVLTETLYSFIDKYNNAFYQSILLSYSSALTGMLSSCFTCAKKKNLLPRSHKRQIVLDFKKLIKKQFKQEKQVKYYAEQLSITPLHLNEVTKEVTGFVASYWIHKEILLEAQRLLCYTELDVKEIAFLLGYEDHTYFSRFFKKNTTHSPGTFRKNNKYINLIQK